MLRNLLLQLVRAPVEALRSRRERQVSPALESALARFSEKKYADAVAACRAVIAQAPRSARAHRLCGRALLALDRHDEAVLHLRAAVATDPGLAETHAELAAALLKTGDLADAEASCRRAVVLRPGELANRLLLVDILEAANRPADALAELSIAQELAPDRYDLLVRLFREISRLGMYAEALHIAERAMHDNGESLETLYLLATARYGSADMQGAVDACRKALTYREDRPDIHVTLGSSLFALGKTDEAVAAYQRALAVDPDFPDAQFHMGLIHLMRGDYREGWQGFEHRFRRARNKSMRPCLPRWNGASLQGRTLLVMREQGLGDEIMFSSCYQQVVDDARRCVIECDPRLLQLFVRSFPGATFYPLTDLHTTAPADPGVAIDARIYAGSLPYYLRRSVGDFPAHQGYLKPDPERVAYWRTHLRALGSGLKVGISWRGGTVFTHRERRTLSLPALLPVLTVPGVRWVNLQYGKRADDIAQLKSSCGVEIVDWPEAIDGNYDETAALVSALDLVISVCTSIVHLTGALGKPVWVMTARVPEWRYGLGGASMPWYPAARLFRQTGQGVWDPVISGIEQALQQYVSAAKAEGAYNHPAATI